MGVTASKGSSTQDTRHADGRRRKGTPVSAGSARAGSWDSVGHAGWELKSSFSKSVPSPCAVRSVCGGSAPPPLGACVVEAQTPLLSEMLRLGSRLRDKGAPNPGALPSADALASGLHPGGSASGCASVWMGPGVPAGMALLSPGSGGGRPAFSSRPRTSLRCWTCCSRKDFSSLCCSLETHSITAPGKERQDLRAGGQERGHATRRWPGVCVPPGQAAAGLRRPGPRECWDPPSALRHRGAGPGGAGCRVEHASGRGGSHPETQPVNKPDPGGRPVLLKET